MPKPCTLTKTERAELQSLIDAYDSARSALLDRATEIRDEWETELDEKSDKWREGDAGEEAQERFDSFGAFVDEIPEENPIIPNDI